LGGKKRGGEEPESVAEVVKHLASKHKALSSNLSYHKKSGEGAYYLRKKRMVQAIPSPF
jgi:hypothetical protein